MGDRRILLVEDDPEVSRLVERLLAEAGYSVTAVATGEEALRAIEGSPAPDAVVLDLMLPGVDGFDVCRRIRQSERTARVPILMLTARSTEADVVAGLDLGADDFVTKPFSTRVLQARLRAVMRRRESIVPPDRDVVRGPLEILPARCEARLEGEQMKLTATEYRLLHLLAQKPGHVFTRSRLLDELHEGPAAVTDRSVDVHIVALRRKLGEHAELVETVRGIGYRFAEEE